MFGSPNGKYNPTLDIYSSKPFQKSKENPIWTSFDSPNLALKLIT